VIAGISCIAPWDVTRAADLGGGPEYPYRPEVVVPYVYNWTGFYVGANVGGAWANGSLNDNLAGVTWDTNASGVAGGFQAGYNYQIKNFVFGAEWNIDWTSIGVTGPAVATPNGILQGSASTNWITTVAGRVGIAADNWLFYGKGGWAWVNNDAQITNLTTGNVVTASDTNNGWLAGGGIEYAFSPNWTTRVEYDYIGLNEGSGSGGGFTTSRDIQLLTVGINYKF
jgi:outer membrane immunogenic protein